MDEFDILLDDYDPFAEEDNTNTNTNNNDNNKKSQHSSTQLLPVNIEEVYGKRDREQVGDPVDSTLTDITPTKKKKVYKKLDAQLLLEPNGIYRIRSETPWLKFKGKGNEAEDLKKLMLYYKVWANQLYPRLNFTDFSDRVMKVASKKQCKMVLDQWREEYKFKNGLNNEKDSQDRVTGELSGMTLEDEENMNKANKSNNNNNSSDEDDSDDDNKMDELEYFNKLIQKATPAESSITPPSLQTPDQQQTDSNRRSTVDGSDDSDEEIFIPSDQIKSIQKKQQSKSILDDNNDDDENMQSSSQRNSSSQQKQTKKILDDSDDDEVMHTSSQQKQIKKILDDSDDDDNDNGNLPIFSSENKSNQSNRSKTIIDDYDHDENNDENNDIEEYVSNQAKQDTQKQEQKSDQLASAQNESKNDDSYSDDDQDEPLFNNNLTSLQSQPLSVDDFFAD